MANDQSSESNEGMTSAGGGVLPVHVMPEDVLQEWSSLSNQTTINVPFTKQELDNLFFALANTQNAIDMTNRAFVQWTNGQIIDAQANLEKSRHSIVAGVNSLRFFFEAFVTAMVRGARGG